MKKATYFLTILLLGTLLCPGCGEATEKKTSNKPTLTLPGGKIIRIEIAKNPAAQARGLMFRKTLPEDAGMLFIYKNDDFHSFWMKNTLIPLDFIWLDRNFKIVYYYTNVPPCRQEPCRSYRPLRKARYFLEVNAGLLKKEALTAGSQLIPNKATRLELW